MKMTKKINLKLDSIVFGLQKRGGISNYWDHLVRYMATRPEVNSKILIPKEIKYADYDFEWHSKCNVNKEFLPTAVSRYLDLGEDGPCDVFHSSYYRSPINKSIRSVVTVHDFIYERYQHGLARKVHSWQKIRSIRRANAVICISNATRDDVLHFVPDIDPSLLHIVMHGVDQRTFFPEQDNNTADLNNMVLYVGQRSGYKRFDLAVEAVRQCRDLSLGIVGPLPTQEEHHLLESQLRGRWHSFGPVSNTRLRQLYSAAFAFIFPSDYEGFGMPILEAMACGCPVVASNSSSIPEVGDKAAVYSLEQKPESYAAILTKLYSSSKDRQTNILAGLQRASELTWESTFNKTIQIYSGENNIK
jgi:mannosyltransferase